MLMADAIANTTDKVTVLDILNAPIVCAILGALITVFIEYFSSKYLITKTKAIDNIDGIAKNLLEKLTEIRNCFDKIDFTRSMTIDEEQLLSNLILQFKQYYLPHDYYFPNSKVKDLVDKIFYRSNRALSLLRVVYIDQDVRKDEQFMKVHRIRLQEEISKIINEELITYEDNLKAVFRDILRLKESASKRGIFKRCRNALHG